MMYSENNALMVDTVGSCIEGKCRQCNSQTGAGMTTCNYGSGMKVLHWDCC